MSIAEEIESVFIVHDYKWLIDGELQVPGVEDITQTIERAKGYIEDGGSIEIGRLIIQNVTPERDKYDVYVYVGTLGEDNDTDI